MADEDKTIKWKSEVDKDDGHGSYSYVEYGEFSELPEWHRDFFRSLRWSMRIEKSMFQVHYGGKDATKLFEDAEYYRGEGLRSTMEVREVSEMIFPLVMYDIERNRLIDALITCIEYEGMKARGVDWLNDDSGYIGFDYIQWGDRGAIRDKYAQVLVNIRDIEAMIREGAIGWKVAKYIKIWRCYLDERINKKSAIGKPEKPSDNKKTKNANRTHEEWFVCACEIVDNWDDQHKKPYLDMRLTANRVCEKVAEKFDVGDSGVKKAISQRVGLYIKELRQKK